MMEAAQLQPYQGLFVLTLGVLAFTLVTFFFRLVGGRRAVATAGAKPDGNAWRAKEDLRIVEIITESRDIKSFTFARANGKDFPPFLAGQFLSLQIGDDPKTLRSYSIASSAHNPKTITVGIKQLKDGVGSGWFHGRKVGDTVKSFPPSGHFTDSGLKDEPRVFVAGGIGITPFLSMIRTALESGAPHPITLFYGMRSTADLAFHGYLALMAERHPRFRYHPILSDKDAGWSGATGFVTSQLIHTHLADSKTAHFFFCGPAVMTDKLMADLLKSGVGEERLHSEMFASPTLFDPETIPHREAVITYLGKSYNYRGKQTILEFLEASGVELPFACRVGVCGSCKCFVKGNVHVITDAGLTLAEKQKGVKLPCVAFPLEDIELEA
jgi:ferredoxin-NADP reductase